MARILFVNLLGIGNCILSTPTIAALSELGHEIEVLVMARKYSRVAFQGWSHIRRVHYDQVGVAEKAYDLALWAHPFVPEYRHPKCELRTIDPNPGDLRPYHKRFDRHEVEEVFQLARAMGYTGAIPPLRPPDFKVNDSFSPMRPIAIGIGYLRFHGMWNNKHWGNRQFSELCLQLLSAGYTPVLLGDDHDQQENGWVIAQHSGATSLCGQMPLEEILGVLRGCVGFIGNDTGLMHAAAAYGLPTVGIFRSTDPIKNAPWGKRCVHIASDLTGPQIIKVFESLSQQA